MDQIYDAGMTDMFDIQEARMSLHERRNTLLAECDANRKLQDRFDEINMRIRSSSVVSGLSSGGQVEDHQKDRD